MASSAADESWLNARRGIATRGRPRLHAIVPRLEGQRRGVGGDLRRFSCDSF